MMAQEQHVAHANAWSVAITKKWLTNLNKKRKNDSSSDDGHSDTKESNEYLRRHKKKIAQNQSRLEELSLTLSKRNVSHLKPMIKSPHEVGGQ